MSDDKKQSILYVNTDKGLKPVAPVDPNASLGDLLVAKEMFADKNDNISAIMVDNEIKWLE